MGLLQKAVETYDANSARVGIVEANRQPLAPIGHIVTHAIIEVTLDAQGHMVNAAKVGKDNEKIIIPATEESAGRTSGIAPHPLCDRFDYLSGQDEKRFHPFLLQLKAWTESNFTHPMLPPILKYLQAKALPKDLKDREFPK